MNKNRRMQFIFFVLACVMSALFVQNAFAEPPFVIRNSDGDTLFVVDEDAIILNKTLIIKDGNDVITSVGGDSIFFDTGEPESRGVSRSFIVGGTSASREDNPELFRLSPDKINKLLVIEHTPFSDTSAVTGVQQVTDWYGIGLQGIGGWKGVEGLVFPFPTGNEPDLPPPSERYYFGLHGGIYDSDDGYSQGDNIGVLGESVGNYAQSNYGVYGGAYYGLDNKGLYGEAEGDDINSYNYGVYATVSGVGEELWAGYFDGDVNVDGYVYSLGPTGVRMDHPENPGDQFLQHASVSSNEMMNMYSGNAAFDADGTAWVTLPTWFETINTDFRYQLTPIGASMPDLYIAREIENNEFQIAGGVAGKKVSWTVHAVRNDPYAQSHPMETEVDKSERDRGKFIAPEFYNRSEADQLHRRPDTAFQPGRARQQ